jgi:methyl-accepting chemotaxis protein
MQKKIIVQTALFPVLSLGAGTVITGYFYGNLVAEASAVEAALPSLTPLFVAVLSFTAIMAGVSLYLALRTSHRIAGPAHRIIQTIRHMRRGDLSVRAVLRTGDLLIEVADELNDALDDMEQQSQVGSPGFTEHETAAAGFAE